MTIAGSANLAAAQATYIPLFQEMWNGQKNYAYLHEVATRTVPVQGTSLRVPVVTSFPRFRQWLGSKHRKTFRAYSQTVDIVTYERTVELTRLEIDADQTGAVRSTLQAFLSDAKMGLDDLLITSLVANTWEGYDGVSLLNNSHPNTNSTGDNLTTSGLSHAEVRTGREAMADYTDEDGTPLNVRPTHLLVGPEQERLALEIAKADRIVPVSNAGALDAGANVVASSTIANVYAGELTVVVSPWLRNSEWFLMDLSKAGLMPFIRPVFREVEPVTMDQMDGYERFNQDTYAFSLEGDFAFAPGLWQLIYGSVTA